MRGRSARQCRAAPLQTFRAPPRLFPRSFAKDGISCHFKTFQALSHIPLLFHPGQMHRILACTSLTFITLEVFTLDSMDSSLFQVDVDRFYFHSLTFAMSVYGSSNPPCLSRTRGTSSTASAGRARLRPTKPSNDPADLKRSARRSNVDEDGVLLAYKAMTLPVACCCCSCCLVGKMNEDLLGGTKAAVPKAVRLHATVKRLRSIT